MFAISQEELALAWVGGAYVVITALYLWLMNRSAEKLLRVIEQHEASEVWQAIGAPLTIKQAVQDPDRRWREFIRSRAYRHVCSPVTASQIDAFLLKTYVGLTGLAVTGAIILVRFWPLLKPALLGE
ncbi:MAG: hypothetical protein JSU95_06880 [Betaproteobacteria bacterium]|nr:MAG: hypothetical protein JSU95_06880 [Betaproteobacteria bacterium]